MPELASVFAQFGPVALICGVLLWINLKHQEQMAQRLNILENELLTLVRNNTEALGLLRDRPCLSARSLK